MKNVVVKTRGLTVGKYIDQNLSETLKAEYPRIYGVTKSSFVIAKDLIKKVFDTSEYASGIRFVYGLEDELNPNSIKVFLIPCAYTSEYGGNPKALISNEGYHDSTGVLYSLSETVTFTANFVSDMIKRNNNLEYKKATRGTFFGKNSLFDLINDPECTAIQYHLGLQNDIIKPILEPLNSSNQTYKDVYMDDGLGCPDYCPSGDDDEPSCLATTVINMYSKEEELNLYRAFRDNVLLNINDGGRLYELYYFISPIITAMINKDVNRKKILKALYVNRILLFKERITQNEFASAALLLDETLKELIGLYGVEFENKSIIKGL